MGDLRLVLQTVDSAIPWIVFFFSTASERHKNNDIDIEILDIEKYWILKSQEILKFR